MVATTRAWVWYGVIGGIIALAATVSAQSVIILVRPSDLCRVGPLSIPLLKLAALFIFLVMAAAAGFASARQNASVAEAAQAGVLVGAIAGLGPLTQLFLRAPFSDRLNELSPEPLIGRRRLGCAAR